MDNLYRELGVRDVLLVGNDLWIKESLSVFFRIQGCRLVSAAGAKEAAKLLSGDRFDLILCDQMLPNGDGLTFLILCGNHQPEAVRVLIASSPSRHVFEEAAKHGIHDVVPKPFSIEAMEKSLKQFHLNAQGRERREVPVE